MPCRAFKTADGLTGFVTLARRPRRRCSACKTAWSTRSCDYPSPARKSGTCDRPLCDGCAVSVGDDLDHCPSHTHAAPAIQQLRMDL